ncbi:MAG: hypothetical protein CSA97_00305 [Bacteroidetes bacterium]|nr:MAG: hypothetical protein CSA97_00305 [Bacteroidota bacterium]
MFIPFCFGDDFASHDSDGDAYPVSSRSWTQLYMSSRAGEYIRFDIDCYSVDPLILEVEGSSSEVAYRVAYFLARETNGYVTDCEGKAISDVDLVEHMGDFDLEGRLELADASIWRSSSDVNPYPNLDAEF